MLSGPDHRPDHRVSSHRRLSHIAEFSKGKCDAKRMTKEMFCKEWSMSSMSDIVCQRVSVR